MENLSENQTRKQEKTLVSALLLSSPGPIVTGIAVLSSHSVTQFADFIRRGAELVAMLVSWWVFRKLWRNSEGEPSESKRAKLERFANLSVAVAMLCSAIIMMLVALRSIFIYETGGNVISGLIIAILGLLVNSFFWRRYGILLAEQYEAVIASQKKLYGAKACVDLCVTIALLVVTFAPNSPITRYVDVFGSIIVACYLFWNSFNIYRKQGNL